MQHAHRLTKSLTS